MLLLTAAAGALRRAPAQVGRLLADGRLDSSRATGSTQCVAHHGNSCYSAENCWADVSGGERERVGGGSASGPVSPRASVDPAASLHVLGSSWERWWRCFAGDLSA